MNKALVTCLISGEYTLYDVEKGYSFLAKPRGIFRNNQVTIKVGDYVEYELGNPFSIITKVDERKNDLVRPMIANVDQAIVVTSLKEPDLNLNLLDRFLAILEYNVIHPILIFSKFDLLKEEEIENIMTIINYYKQIGYPTFMTTHHENIINDSLLPYIQNKISVMVGQSGVGKSSLINLMDDKFNLKTGDISKALNRGKHTTRYTALLPYKGGWIADCPGFGAVDLTEFDEKTLSQSFKEFFEASRQCKYNGCLHLNEPGCFVKKEVEKKHILSSRYENYRLLQQEIKKNKNFKRKW